MQVEIDDRLVALLRQMAAAQGRDIAEVIGDAIEQFIERHSDPAFDADIQRIIQEHAWLLDELSRS